jgi:hypothetical protein
MTDRMIRIMPPPARRRTILEAAGVVCAPEDEPLLVEAMTARYAHAAYFIPSELFPAAWGIPPGLYHLTWS